MKELDFLFVTPKAPLTARWYPPPDNIVDINGDKWIVGHRHKTGIPFQVKLMDVPLQIIDRYKHLQEDKLIFGKNERLVDVQEAEDSDGSLWNREIHKLSL